MVKNPFEIIIRHFFITVFFLITGVLFAKSQIIVDASLKDWGDSTQFKYDDQNKLWYSFKKDDQFLYLAIKKNKNAGKYQIGGIQLSFSSTKIDSTSLRFTYAQSMSDPQSGKLIYFSHEYFEIANWDDYKNGLYPKFNELGTLVEWNFTNIDFIPKNNVINYAKDIPADPNVFISEIQIPLTYLKKKFGEKFNFSICLPGFDKKKKGMEAYLKNSFATPKNIAEIEDQEKMYFTEFFGTINLSQI